MDLIKSLLPLGTFILDPALLFISGYFITYLIYRYITPRVKISAVRRFFVLLFPISLLALSAGAALPYFNLVDSSDVYLGLLPQSFVGPLNGNDFMWNGLGLHLLIGDRLVPESLIPTYNYFWFNVLAFLIWTSYLPILAWGVLEGQAAALIKKPKPKLFLLHCFKIAAIGISLSVLAAAITALVAKIYVN
ncbi:MAG: hypothetical protein AAB646_02840 [Patescibacteria group bacterium]